MQDDELVEIAKSVVVEDFEKSRASDRAMGIRADRRRYGQDLRMLRGVNTADLMDIYEAGTMPNDPGTFRFQRNVSASVPRPVTYPMGYVDKPPITRGFNIGNYSPAHKLSVGMKANTSGLRRALMFALRRGR